MTEISIDDEVRIAEEVERAVQGYVESLRSLDADGILSFWADIEGFTMAGDGGLVVGREPWAREVQALVDTMSEVTRVVLSNQQVYVLGLDAASYSTEFEWSMIGKDGETKNAKGSWTYVLKRFPEGWRAVHSAGTHIFS